MRLKYRARRWARQAGRLGRHVGLLGEYRGHHRGRDLDALIAAETQEFTVHIVAEDSPSRRHPYVKEAA